MKSMSGKQLCRVLEQHGWRLLRVHGNTSLKTGLLRHLLS